MSANDSKALKPIDKNPDDAMGAVAQDRPGQPNNVADLNQQIDHRDQRAIKKDSDTDFPEPGSNPEYSMQKDDKPTERPSDPQLRPKNDPDGNAGAELNDNDPGERQKQNQNQKKDDDLAA